MDNSKFCCETALCICCKKASADRSSAEALAKISRRGQQNEAGLAHGLIPKDALFLNLLVLQQTLLQLMVSQEGVDTLALLLHLLLVQALLARSGTVCPPGDSAHAGVRTAAPTGMVLSTGWPACRRCPDTTAPEDDCSHGGGNGIPTHLLTKSDGIRAPPCQRASPEGATGCTGLGASMTSSSSSASMMLSLRSSCRLTPGSPRMASPIDGNEPRYLAERDPFPARSEPHVAEVTIHAQG